MSHVEINVRDTWQLISQFVCWDICRYAGEQNENISSDIDVLSFLRNMIVKRTEKSLSDITKPEIIAKFIMEIKTIKDLSRLPSIIELSKSVVRICPELEKAVGNLIYHVETLMNILDSEENFKEAIKRKINDLIHDFSKEASTFLPQPDLIKIVESWEHHHGNSKLTEKDFSNTMLFERVLKCLHFEKITQPEAKLIAVLLHEDRVFENTLLNILNKLEPKADMVFSFLQSSQPNEYAHSQELVKGYQKSKSKEASFQSLFSCTDSLPLVTPLVEPGKMDNVDNLSNNSFELVPTSEQISIPSRTYRSNDLDDVYQSYPSHNKLLNTSKVENKEGSNLQDNSSQIHSTLSNMSDSDKEYGLLTRNNEKLNNMNNQMELGTQSQSDSDTSDCEKYSEFRFLTPSLYRQGADNLKQFRTKRVYLSDSDPNDSFVATPANVPKWHSPKASSKTVRRNGNKHLKMKTTQLCNSDDDLVDTVAGSKTSSAAMFSLPIIKRHNALSKTVKLFRSETNFYDSYVSQENNSTG